MFVGFNQVACNTANSLTVASFSTPTVQWQYAQVQADVAGAARYTCVANTTANTTSGMVLPANTTIVLRAEEFENINVRAIANTSINVQYQI